MAAAKKHKVNVQCEVNYAPLIERDETTCAIVGRMYDVVRAHAFACYAEAINGASSDICEALTTVDKFDDDGHVAVY